MKKIITLLLGLCLILPGLASCKEKDDVSNDTADYEYNDDNYIDENDENYDDTEENTGFALIDGIMTEELAYEIYTIMDLYSFGEYRYITDSEETWNAYTDDEKTELFENISAMATELGLIYSCSSESEWLEKMNEDVNYYSLWASAYMSLSMDTESQRKMETCSNVYYYVQGIEDGKYSPLHPEILAKTDSYTVEYYQGDYLLCIGGSHNITQITREFANNDYGIFTQSGSVTSVVKEDIFESEDASYYISGGEGKFENVDFGDADFIPILQSLGAADDDGTLINEQIQISAITLFNAETLYIHTQDGEGLIKFAVVRFNEDTNLYEWDGEIFVTPERTCFGEDKIFRYIDENGTLQSFE